MIRNALTEALHSASKTRAYANYLQVREQVLDMVDMQQDRQRLGEDEPSGYWTEELAGFEYMLDASPLIIQSLREHCYHLTGTRSYDYRRHHRHKSRPFAEKLESLRGIDADGLLVAESPLLGGFGHEIDGVLINIDTLKYYECLIALSLRGLLAPLLGASQRGQVILEIGAGWGGFAYQLKTLCPKVTYVIVDLPQTLLFSGTYLLTVFPGASVHFAKEASEDLTSLARESDFVLIPHFLFKAIKLARPNLAINIASFQEMTTEQVRQYIQRIRALDCPSFYSLNRDRSSHNEQLTSVRSILAEFCSVEELSVLRASYTTLGRVPPGRQEYESSDASLYDYHHLFGRVDPV